ncbi:hypothetical protein AMECASPLE_004298 [Ameca splendens]|uniref:Beta-N-acetylhexosaminidase n=1 Tax=Ameca splendens TaxID=208324 RepID=A0ABV0YWS2_9TELE
MLCPSTSSNFVYVPSQAENLNLGFISLNTDFVSRSFRMIKIIYVLRTLFPNYCFHLDWDQAGSFLLPPSPGPRHKRTLSNLQRKYLHNELTPDISKFTPTAPKRSSEQTLLRQPGSRIPLPLAT